jgi:XTP/dITP diphosphohydrolase
MDGAKDLSLNSHLSQIVSLNSVSMHDVQKILIATGNRGKAREIAGILKTVGTGDFEFALPFDLGIMDSPIEDGKDYEENASIKAEFYGARSGILTIADDSGLEVDALHGFPGIKSARLESTENTDKSRYKTLLDLMKDVEDENRTARFVCVATAFLPETKKIITSRAEWNGLILNHPDGDSGFGYDPVFYDPSIGKSAARLTTDEKNRISHRGKAFRMLWDSVCEQGY